MYVEKQLIEKWLKGWSISRGTPMPVRTESGFRVDVGWKEQMSRYVFPEVCEELYELANAITDTDVHLKVCAQPDVVSKQLPDRWVLQPQGYLMTCTKRMVGKPVALNDGHVLDIEQTGVTAIVKVFVSGNEIAIGRIVMVDDIAIYDRIITQPSYRRMGLATVVMQALERIATSQGSAKGVLVATEEGKALYEALGWELLSFYTSFVIPSKNS